MITKIFDNGWGAEYPLKKYEQEIVQSLIKNFSNSTQNTVLINSVWYTNDYHSQVMQWLKSNTWDQIVLIAMIDAAIPSPQWYEEFNRPVSTIGYYPGPGQVDFCALFVDRYLQAPDPEEILNSSRIDTPYMCLMRKPHWHRRKLFKKLIQHQVLEQGLVSMGSESGTAAWQLPTDRTHDNLAPNAESTHYGVPNDIVSLGHMENWQRHFLNVVAETFYDINTTNFVSEKIYKPIVGCRPFLVYDPDGATRWLTERKFEPYVDDFNDITDLDLRYPVNVPKFLAQLVQQPQSYWQSKLIDLRPKILYNRQRFREYVEEQQLIVKQGIPCQI